MGSACVCVCGGVWPVITLSPDSITSSHDGWQGALGLYADEAYFVTLCSKQGFCPVVTWCYWGGGIFLDIRPLLLERGLGPSPHRMQKAHLYASCVNGSKKNATTKTSPVVSCGNPRKKRHSNTNFFRCWSSFHILTAKLTPTHKCAPQLSMLKFG